MPDTLIFIFDSSHFAVPISIKYSSSAENDIESITASDILFVVTAHSIKNDSASSERSLRKYAGGYSIVCKRREPFRNEIFSSGENESAALKDSSPLIQIVFKHPAEYESMISSPRIKKLPSEHAVFKRHGENPESRGEEIYFRSTHPIIFSCVAVTAGILYGGNGKGEAKKSSKIPGIAESTGER